MYVSLVCLHGPVAFLSSAKSFVTHVSVVYLVTISGNGLVW